MSSFTRPSRLLSRTTNTTRSSLQLRRSLPSSTAAATTGSSCLDQPRFLRTVTSSSLPSRRMMFADKSSSIWSHFRSYHATPHSLEDAAAATEAANNEDGDEPPHPTEIDYAFTPPPPLSEDSMKKVNGLFDQILHLDMIEVHLLTMVVNEQLGIKWNQVQGAGAGPIGGGAAASAAEEAPAEEKLLKDLKLVGFYAKAKIKVIKEVRSIAGLGLKEAKELVEGAPKVIQKELKPEKAEELKAQLEAVGAQIEIC